MTWYNTGIVTTTTNSTVVIGNGTAWTTSGLRPGDMLLIGYNTASPRPFEIKSIDSATQITLVIAFPVAVTAAAYVGIPMLSGDRTAITMTLAQQVTKAFTDNQAMQAVWQAFYSGSGTITLTMPDGSTVTGYSFLKLTADMAGKANKTDLGTAASKNSGTAPGNVMPVGAFGLGANIIGQASWAAPTDTTRFIEVPPNSGSPFGTTGGCGITISSGASAYGIQLMMPLFGDRLVMRSWTPTAFSSATEFWSTKNTTVDSNGFIKRASPIARLSSNPTEMQPDYMKGFMPAGIVAVNEEAEGVVGERISEGVYAIIGSLGLAEDGWTIEVPQDVNGNRLLFVKTITTEDGTVTVSTFKRKFCTESAMIIAGEPMDIPDGRWIDIRLQMPDKAAIVFTEETNLSS